MKPSPEEYTRIAVEIAKCVLAVVDLNQIAQVGHERVMADIFDFTDAFCAELGARLEPNAKETT